MCLITFAYKTHPKYRLIVAANRDEFYDRPTRTAQFWKNENKPQILAGKDLKANGTWMGVSKVGKWAALTNYRDLSTLKNEAPSRGELVLDYLDSDIAPLNYLKGLQPQSLQYNGFNILVGNEMGLYHYSNYDDVVTEIDAGIHGVSNALLNTPWPKLERAKLNLREIISEPTFNKEGLFHLLRNSEQAADKDLPDTGIPYELEKTLSSIYIDRDNYGTLCSTLLLTDYEGNTEFIERRYDPKTNEVISDKTFNF